MKNIYYKNVIQGSKGDLKMELKGEYTAANKKNTYKGMLFPAEDLSYSVKQLVNQE